MMTMDRWMTVRGTLDDGVMLTYRTSAESVREIVPRGLELVEKEGDAFWNIVACRVRWGGRYSHAQVAYRLHVLRGDVQGLYFVRTDVDRALVAAAGNLMADHRLHRSDVRLRREIGVLSVEVDSGDGAGDARFYADLTVGDPFARPNGVPPYRPIGLTPGRMFCPELLSELHETPITVLHAVWALLERRGQRGLRLARAVRFGPLAVRWPLRSRRS